MGKCSCCSVRTLCTILAVLAMMGAVFQVYRDGNQIANHIATEEEDRKTFSPSLISDSVPVPTFFQGDTGIEKEIKQRDDVRSFFKMNFFFLIIDVILNLGMIGASVCLLYGVYNKEVKFLLPLFWFLPSELVVRCFFVFVLFTYFGITSPPSLRVDALFSFVILYNTIFWLCVKSHKEQLISNNNNNQHVPG